MPIGFYMDVHIPKAITIGLRLRAIDVLTAQEDGATTLSDADLLDRATEPGRTLYSHDDDLLAEAHTRLSLGKNFAGVIYSHQLTSPIGHCIEDLEIIAKICEPIDMLNQIEFIPF
jgi:hypothetical protein